MYLLYILDVRGSVFTLVKEEYCGKAHEKMVISIVSAFALVFGLTLVAVPAHAGVREDNCPSGTTCTWGDRYYLTSGKAWSRIYFYQYVSNYTTLTYPGTSRSGNDSATSIFNHGLSETSHMYLHAGRNQRVLQLPLGAGYSQLNAQVPSANDSISSGYYSSFN